MAPSATLLYGWAIKHEELPQEAQSWIEDNFTEMGGRYDLAAYLLHKEGVKTEDWDDHVTLLHDRTGIWMEAYGEDHTYFITLKETQGWIDHGYRKVTHFTVPDQKRHDLLTLYAVDVLGATGEPGWYLIADII